jgi:hypothetical protein
MLQAQIYILSLSVLNYFNKLGTEKFNTVFVSEHVK